MSSIDWFERPRLTREEACVLSALEEYADHPSDGVTAADWVPTSTLFRLYLHYYGVNYWRSGYDHPKRLGIREFGRAVNKVFPNAERCKRSYCSKQMYGYSHLRGPDSYYSVRLADN